MEIGLPNFGDGHAIRDRRVTHRVSSILLLGLAVAACRTSQDTGQPNASPTSAAAAQSATAVPGTMKGFETMEIVLYQPDATLRERVPSVEVFAAYAKEVQAACAAHFADVSAPEALDVVVAIKPNGRSRVWFVSSSRSEGDESLGRLREKIESVKPPTIRIGPVAFAIMATVAGAKREPPGPDGSHVPMPKAWRDAASKSPQPALVPDDVLHYAWPDP
jgi:hypothetical protein